MMLTLEELVAEVRAKYGPDAPVTKDYEAALRNAKRQETSARDLFLTSELSPQELVRRQKDTN
jgi:hypothetical protein